MNDLIDTWGYFSSVFVFLFGFFLVLKTSSFLRVSQKKSSYLYLWHTFMCLIYLWYVVNNGGDALVYYHRAGMGDYELRPGTNGVVLLNSIFVYGFKFSLLGSFLVNNIFGSLGLVFLYSSLDYAVKNKGRYVKNLSFLIVFLPSISFWSSSLGKDSIAFMATAFSLWAAINLEKRIFFMGFSIFIMFLVRPHMAGLMIIALSLSVILSSKVGLIRRFLIGFIAIFIAAALVPFAIQYAGVEDPTSIDSVADYVESRQGLNMHGGGSVDISSMSLPMQLFTYVFRPTVLEATNIFTFAAALDNLILLYLFIAGGFALIKKRKRNFTENRKFMWVYAGLAWLVLAMTTANLGIAVRQKWMFAPFLIFLLISLIGKEKRSPSTIAAQQMMPRYRVK